MNLEEACGQFSCQNSFSGEILCEDPAEVHQQGLPPGERAAAMKKWHVSGRLAAVVQQRRSKRSGHRNSSIVKDTARFEFGIAGCPAEASGVLSHGHSQNNFPYLRVIVHAGKIAQSNCITVRAVQYRGVTHDQTAILLGAFASAVGHRCQIDADLKKQFGLP